MNRHFTLPSEQRESIKDQWQVSTASIPFGPRGCPQARKELIKMWVIPRMHEVFDGMFVDRSPDSARDLKVRLFQLERSQLYWVSEPMCQLLNHAERTVPLDITLLDEMVPATYGLIFFAAKRLACEDSFQRDGSPVYVDAVSWSACPVIREDGPHPELTITSYNYNNGPIGHWIPVGGRSWPRGTLLGERDTESDDLQHASVIEDRRLIAAFFSLIASPGVSTTSLVRADRATARRAARDGSDRNDDVRVIYLRSARSNQDDSAEGHEYRHRWVVSGHWRSQPYGPQRAYRKAVWIAPHVKGPEGAPLLHGEKVQAWVR